MALDYKNVQVIITEGEELQHLQIEILQNLIRKTALKKIRALEKKQRKATQRRIRIKRQPTEIESAA